MELKEVVDRYQALAGWGQPVALAAFGLSKLETVRLFSALDEDYHISRFLKFSLLPGETYDLGGNPVSHVAIDAGIRSVL